MSSHPFKKPKLPSHYFVWCEPPDDSGDELLHIVSDRRRFKLKGHSFREFQRSVIPLLDGEHTREEIQRAVAELFAPEDLDRCLQLLADHRLLHDADGDSLGALVGEMIVPQLNFFHEMDADAAAAQARLLNATVTVVGLGGAGALATLSLAAARVGALRCVDALPVGAQDPYLSPVFSMGEVGTPRAAVVAGRVEGLASSVKTMVNTDPLESDADVLRAIEGSDFVISCLDPGQSSLVYKLNRACLAARLRWSSCVVAGAEAILGPTVHPFETACYLCYKMRTVACAGNPGDEFAFERFLDQRKRNDSGRRGNVVFGVAIAANMLALEVVKSLTGFAPPSALGRIVVFDLLELSSSRHVVLRKPWCPACFPPSPAEHAHR